MDPAHLSDDQLDDLAAKLAPRLPTGTHGDRVILSRRQFAAAATGTLGAGALIALGVDPASAQAAGSQGTADEPNDMFAYDLNVANGVTSSLPMNGNDIENAGAVSVESVNISNSLDASLDQGSPASPVQFITLGSESGEDLTGIATASTTITADNTAETILELESLTERMANGQLVVMGNEGDRQFTDTVRLAGLVNISKDSDSAERGSPQARSYSVESGTNNIRVTIDGGGETYNITLLFLGGGGV